MSKSNIEWTEKTWNFLAGCSKVSDGCKNCYAIKMANRLAQISTTRKKYASTITDERGFPNWSGELTFSEETLLAPLKWKATQMVFVNSMSDLFHEKVKDEWLDQAFAVMALTPHITYQILTKRPERMREYFAGIPDVLCERWWQAAPEGSRLTDAFDLLPLPNVWFGVSVEDQKTADERIPLLLQTPAAVRWISAEPLLGPVDLTNIRWSPYPQKDAPQISGVIRDNDEPDDWRYWSKRSGGVDWVVVGGESGPNARPFDIQWARDIIAQCKAADVPVFVKQLGARPCEKWFDGRCGLGLKDRKGGDPSEWPEDLQVREFPI